MGKIYTFILLCLTLLATDAKAQWTNLNAPKSNYEDYQLLAVSDDGKNFAALSGKLNTTTFKVNLIYTTSHDYGATWQVFPTNQVGGGQSMFWDGDDLYVQTSNASIADLKKSSDFGANFTVQNSSYNTQTPIVRSSNGKWYLENSSILNYSSDKGANWIKKDLGSGQYFIDYVVAKNGNIVATVNGGAAYSNDGGETWIFSNFPSDNLKTIYNSISKSTDGTLLIFKQSTPTSLVCKSTDNGVSWQVLSVSLPANTKKLLYCGTNMLAYTTLGSTFISTDAGLTFSAMNPATPLATTTDMIVSKSNAYIFGMSGIYKYGNSTTGFTSPLSDSKLSVFPNPCKEIINLKSNTKYDSYIITNLTGQVVRESNTVNNQINFSLLKPGIYILTLNDESNNRTSVKIEKQ